MDALLKCDPCFRPPPCLQMHWTAWCLWLHPPSSVHEDMPRQACQSHKQDGHVNEGQAPIQALTMLVCARPTQGMHTQRGLQRAAECGCSLETAYVGTKLPPDALDGRLLVHDVAPCVIPSVYECHIQQPILHLLHMCTPEVLQGSMPCVMTESGVCRLRNWSAGVSKRHSGVIIAPV